MQSVAKRKKCKSVLQKKRKQKSRTTSVVYLPSSKSKEKKLTRKNNANVQTIIYYTYWKERERESFTSCKNNPIVRTIINSDFRKSELKIGSCTKLFLVRITGSPNLPHQKQAIDFASSSKSIIETKIMITDIFMVIIMIIAVIGVWQ